MNLPCGMCGEYVCASDWRPSAESHEYTDRLQMLHPSGELYNCSRLFFCSIPLLEEQRADSILCNRLLQDYSGSNSGLYVQRCRERYERMGNVCEGSRSLFRSIQWQKMLCSAQ